MQKLPDNVRIEEDEDISPFIRGKISIIQKKKGYRFNVDSLLLVSFVNLSPSKVVIDIGTGSGIIPLLLNLKIPKLKLYGLEVQESMFSLAKKNFILNSLNAELRLGDVKDVRDIFQSGFFDCVITNPPYFHQGSVERAQVLATFGDFVKAASYLLKNKGKFYYIFPVSSFIESLETVKKYRLQPKRIRFVHPSIMEKATHFMVECLKSGKEGGEIVEKPLIMYENPKEKRYTQEAWNLLENFPDVLE